MSSSKLRPDFYYFMFHVPIDIIFPFLEKKKEKNPILAVKYDISLGVFGRDTETANHFFESFIKNKF